MHMTHAQRETVEMILGTLPEHQAYRSINNTSDSDVLILSPDEPSSVILVTSLGSTGEFHDGEWHTGWEA